MWSNKPSKAIKVKKPRIPDIADLYPSRWIKFLITLPQSVNVVIAMTENQNPEQKARDTIDALLRQVGWVVQHAKKIDLNVGLGQAVREYQTDVGPADYVLFVNKKTVGVIEAKREAV